MGTVDHRDDLDCVGDCRRRTDAIGSDVDGDLCVCRATNARYGEQQRRWPPHDEVIYKGVASKDNE